MKLFLVFMVLLFEVPQDRAWPKKCFNNVSGLCRKRCKLGEISEMGCLSGKLCCVNEGENRKYLEARKPPAPTADKSAEVQDYIALPTTTLLTTAAAAQP